MIEEQQILFTDDVKIKQVSIEIKVMKIGNKQVTLSVFRQLPVEDIIDLATGELCGVPWGRVNYHVDCEKYKGHHIHVVWQKGNELRRSVASQFWPREYPTTWGQLEHETCVSANCYMAARVLEGYGADKLHRGYIGVAGLSSTFILGVEGDKVEFYPSDALRTCWKVDDDGRVMSLHHEEKIRAIVPEWGLSFSAADIRNKALLPALKKQRDFEAVWKQSYAQIEQLDQLFIAV